jgi:rSAM/selenodomain-associated transferase 2
MAAPISIVIPTLNAADGIAPTLACLVEGVSMGLVRELIIVDGGSKDDIAQITKDVGARFLTCEAGRGRQLAVGADHAQAPWLLFIHADTVLDADWAVVIATHINNQSKAGYGRLSFDDTGVMSRCVSAGANLRSRLFGLPYGDQGLLISRQMYDQVGGYRDIPLMEDVAIARALRGQLRQLDMTATTSAARYHRQGWWARIFKNLMLLARFKMGADPKKLARAYRR